MEEEDAIHIGAAYASYVDGAAAEETAEIIKTLEESNDSDDYECMIIVDGWMEIYGPEDMDEDGFFINEGEYVSLCCKYYVSKEVAEEFVEYIESIRMH